MTHLAMASADATAPAADPPGAAELAARIHVPRRLPVRHDGRPMSHLSNSSYTKFLLCPEDWRRHYLKGERFAPSGPMFLGSRVDDAVSLYYRRILEHGDTLTLAQVKDAYRELWQTELAAEDDKLGVRWDDGLSEPRGFELGVEALELTFAELVPRLGAPVAVQRKLEFTIAPGLEWTVQCYLDLETQRRDDAGDVAAAVVDYKVKSTPHSQTKADADPQAGLYLAARWLTGEAARDFSFAQIAKPGKRRKHMSASLVTTQRTIGQLRGSLARIAQAARQIHVLHERLGPDAPWGFADPAGWKCAPAYCRHYARSCPGGAGL
jgi:hypothetical protein